MRIFLIGFMGAGKSSVAPLLAEALGTPCIDLDHEIEQWAGKSVTEIFKSEGEQRFRLTESQLLKKFIAEKQSFVMATGGGTPAHFDGIGRMNHFGTTILLDAPLSDLIPRLRAQKKQRPLANDLAALHQLFAERQKFYQKAQYHVPAHGSPALVCDRIMSSFRGI